MWIFRMIFQWLHWDYWFGVRISWRWSVLLITSCWRYKVSCEYDADVKLILINWTSLIAQMVKHLPVMQETQVWSLDWEDPLEKEEATHSSILAWKIPWTEDPGRLQSMQLQRVGHDWVTHTHTSSGCQILCSKVMIFLFQFYWETIEIYPCIKFQCTEWWLDLHILLNVLSVDLVSIHCLM